MGELGSVLELQRPLTIIEKLYTMSIVYENFNIN